jgi:hypothetical protein
MEMLKQQAIALAGAIAFGSLGMGSAAAADLPIEPQPHYGRVAPPYGPGPVEPYGPPPVVYGYAPPPAVVYYDDPPPVMAYPPPYGYAYGGYRYYPRQYGYRVYGYRGGHYGRWYR